MIIAYYIYKRLKKETKYKRLYSVHPIILEKNKFGGFITLYHVMRQYEQKFVDYFRMKISTFDKLLSTIENKIQRENTKMRESIPPYIRLAVTLRYLETGDTFARLHFDFRIGIKTIANIVREVTYYIWSELSTVYMRMPTQEEWLEVAQGFEINANFPHCLGALDGKHIRIIKPKESGSMFLNYKHFFSIVLMAVADSNYNFVFIDVGSYGKKCDSAVFKETQFWKKMIDNTLNIPSPCSILNTNYVLPYVFVADEAFALHTNLLRPYGGNELTKEQKIFNYRLTRARRYVECAFGIMSNKWRILHRPINVNLDLAVGIIKTTCVLQNFIHTEEGHKESSINRVRLNSTLYLEGNNLTAKDIRHKFTEYFSSDEGALPWQDKYT